MRFQKVIWSPVEEQWLRTHSSLPINQLTQMLSKSRSAIKKKIDELTGTTTKKSNTSQKYKTKLGKRVDCNNQYFRSSWEANSFRWIMNKWKNVHHIEVEPTDFSFAPFGILKGTVSYTPDFKVVFKDETYLWIEVKGFLERQGQTKINRFRKFYPEEFCHLRAITGGPNTKATKFFKSIKVPVVEYIGVINKIGKKEIKNWE